jgi:hypothetical protein
VIALLDVNVLIALVDTVHAFHVRAHRFFSDAGQRGWATCPITENGLLRIVGHPGYPGSPGSPAMALPLLKRFQAVPGHVFWPDDISLLDSDAVDVSAILTSAQLSDTYLLALAVSKGGRLATFDRRLSTAAVKGGAAALEVIA